MIEIVSAWGHEAEIRELFSEYTGALLALNSSYQIYLDIQNYEDELTHLHDKYGEPQGRLYLALCDGEPAGCIALRQLCESEHTCEMKRLFVRPQFRNCGLGSALIQRIIEDALSIGYAAMLLDTIPAYQAAIHLYKKYGFCMTDPYNESPPDATLFMRLDLERLAGPSDSRLAGPPDSRLAGPSDSRLTGPPDSRLTEAPYPPWSPKDVESPKDAAVLS